MNDLILADQELEVGFIGKLDVLLQGIERMSASCKASPGNEQFLTDKEVSAWLKVSRRTLQDYRNNGMIAYYQLGGKILYRDLCKTCGNFCYHPKSSFKLSHKWHKSVNMGIDITSTIRISP